MIYTKEFVELVYFNYPENIYKEIDEQMLIKNHNKVRILLEDSLDDKLMFHNGKIRDAYKSTYNNRKKAYSLFMTNYIKELDHGNNHRR